jgi:hypothetical protein
MKFKKKSIKLKPGHQWKTPDGYQLIVLDRGAVHICFPQGWEVKPQETGSILLSDAEPPLDDCRMEVSYWRLNPAAARIYPFEKMVSELLRAKGEMEHESVSEPVVSKRDRLRFGWVESTYPDPDNGRPVRSRTLLVFGNCIQVLLSYACWEDDVERFMPVWKTMMKTMRLGEYVSHPATGSIIRPHLN